MALAMTTKYFAILAAFTTAALAQRPVVGPFTAAQSAAGRAAYTENCSGCHQPDLGGRNEAPQLAGSNFMAMWGSKSTSALITYMQGTMPPEKPGRIGAD